MNLYFNTDSYNFVNSPIDFSPVNSVGFIFGASENINVTLVNAANGAYVLPSGYNMVLGLKLPGTFLTGNYLAYGNANVVPNTGLGNYAYGITGFNLYTTGISGLLAQNSNITLAMELEYDNNGSGVVLSNPNTCTINNSYINLNQVPFITGALAVYPAPNNIQTVSNLGVTYAPLVGGIVPTGNLPAPIATGNFQTVSDLGVTYPPLVSGQVPSSYLTNAPYASGSYTPFQIETGNFSAIKGGVYGMPGGTTGTPFTMPNNGDWFGAFDVLKTWGTSAAVIGTTGNNFIDTTNTSPIAGPYNLNAVPYIGQGVIRFVWVSSISAWSVN